MTPAIKDYKDQRLFYRRAKDCAFGHCTAMETTLLMRLEDTEEQHRFCDYHAYHLEDGGLWVKSEDLEEVE